MNGTGAWRKGLEGRWVPHVPAVQLVGENRVKTCKSIALQLAVNRAYVAQQPRMGFIRILASSTSCDSERTVNRLGCVASQIRRAME